MVNGQKKFLIPILKESLDIDSVPRDMQMYLRTYTYIDGINYKKDLHRLEKRLFEEITQYSLFLCFIKMRIESMC